MSGDRKTRRRFIADALFAGGALTAASVLGYNATHQAAEAAPQVEKRQAPKPACTPTDSIRPPGEMVAPQPAPSQTPLQQPPVQMMHPSGAVAPTQVAPTPAPRK